LSPCFAVLRCERVLEQIGAGWNDPGVAAGASFCRFLRGAADSYVKPGTGKASHGCSRCLSSRRTLPSTCRMAQ
jgi:hypothetical protein